MKKLNSKGFTHHLVMFAVLALVLGAMGFAGYRVWQKRNIDAHAGGCATTVRLTAGTTQTCVKNLKTLLNYTISGNSSSPISISPNYDTATVARVKQYQSSKGIIVDGIVNIYQTWPALCYDASKSTNADFKNAAITAGCNISPPVAPTGWTLIGKDSSYKGAFYACKDATGSMVKFKVENQDSRAKERMLLELPYPYSTRILDGSYLAKQSKISDEYAIVAGVGTGWTAKPKNSGVSSAGSNPIKLKDLTKTILLFCP